MARHLHRLVELILDGFASLRFHVVESGLLGGPLRLKSLSFVLVRVRGEGLPHVGRSLVFLVNQVICGCDVVVTVRLQTSNRVVLVKLEVINQSLKDLFLEGHLLESGEKSRLAMFGHGIFLRTVHVWVISDLTDADTRLGVRIQHFFYEIFALT